jgi:hypothetical protein
MGTYVNRETYAGCTLTSILSCIFIYINYLPLAAFGLSDAISI